MATTKLYWNGSTWSTSSAHWFTKTTTTTGVSCYVTAVFNIIVDSDKKIWFDGYIRGGWQDGAVCNGYRNVTVGGSQVGQFNCSNNHNTAVKVQVGSTSSPTPTVAFNSNTGDGKITSYYNGNYGSSWNKTDDGSASTALSTPFYTITYYWNNTSSSTSDSFASQTEIKNYGATVTSSVPTRSGWTFLGWSTSYTATTATYDPGDTITARSSNLNLYAVWAKSITITAPEGVTITLGNKSVNNASETYDFAIGTHTLTMTPDAGWIIKTRSPDASVSSVSVARNATSPSNISLVTATSQRVGCRIDDGAAWQQYLIYIDNGASWDLYLAYYDDGAQWNLLN